VVPHLHLEAPVAFGEALARELRRLLGGSGGDQARELHPIQALRAQPGLQRDAEALAQEVVHRHVEGRLGHRLAGVEPRGELGVHLRVRAGDVEHVMADERGREVLADRAHTGLQCLGRPAARRAGLAPADAAVGVGHLHQRDALAFGQRARGPARQGEHCLHWQAQGKHFDRLDGHV